VIRSRTRREWIDRLVPAGVPSAAVRGLDEVLTDPQSAAREMIQAIGLAPSLATPAPAAGQSE
jgi:crotonobetainyl-CoA:carnitine CoA-transferase CaiB-like acyl-CoA transferase